MRRNAIVGSIVWCGLFLGVISTTIDLSWIELIFLFAPLVIFPLGIVLTDRLDQNTAISYPERFGRTMQLPAAILATASFLFQPGILAAALAVSWLGVCVLFALGGALRTSRGAYAQLERLCTAVSFLYLAIGGSWLFASRLGLNPLGFQEPIVLLTGIHFHYAGFAAPVLARSVGRALGVSNGAESRVLLRVMIAGVLAAPGTLSLGFVIGPRTKLLAALFLAASEIGLAISFVCALRNAGQLSAEILLTVAAASVGFSMAFAVVWAIGEYPLQPFVHLGEMEALHGTANAFGFTLCGLLGWIFAAHNEGPTQEQQE
jgi:hypothetical protein